MIETAQDIEFNEVKINGNIYNVASEIYLNILVTDRCNCECPFCIANLKCDKLECNVDLYKEKIDFAINHFNIKDIVFVGGEPTFSSNFFVILNRLKQYSHLFNNVILTTNGILLRNKSIMDKIIDSPVTAINISYHHYDKNKNDEIFGNNTLTKEEIINIYKRLSSKNITLRLNNCMFKNSVDSVDEMKKFVNYFKGCVDIIKFTPVMKTLPFDTVNQIIEYTENNAINIDEVTRLMDSFEKDSKLIERNEKVFGTIPYSLVQFNNQQVLLNYLHLEDKKDKKSTITSLKLLPTGQLKNNWNRDDSGITF